MAISHIAFNTIKLPFKIFETMKIMANIYRYHDSPTWITIISGAYEVRCKVHNGHYILKSRKRNDLKFDSVKIPFINDRNQSTYNLRG